MKKEKVMNIVLLILVLSWMLVVFLLSNEPSEQSGKTSGNTIKAVITIFNKDISNSELESLVEILQPIARKIAHFTLYTFGGIIIYSFICHYFKTRVNKTSYPRVASILIGCLYSITDEIHQLFIPGRSGEFRDVCIDTLGIILGVMAMHLVNRFLSKLKYGNK
ncbi:MAG: VanZ family protein [Clostridia bacterium]|nr:VanZ family protein [Clostridia bacterium]